MKKSLYLSFSASLLCGCLLAQTVGDIGNVTDIDENVYETKYLQDNNWWMMENLQVRHKPDGSTATFYFPWNGSANDSTLLASGTGLLYNRTMLLGWPHQLRAQGLCPDGWHVPTLDELGALNVALGGQYTWWNGNFHWEPLNDALNLAAIRGGKYTPPGTAQTDEAIEGWGTYLMTSTNTYGNEPESFLLGIGATGENGGPQLESKNLAGNCRCVKNRPLVYQVSNLTDNGLTVSLSTRALTSVSQIKLYDITEPTDPWEVALTSVVFSADTLSATIVAYLDVSLGAQYEVRFLDTQAPNLPLSGYDITKGTVSSTSVTNISTSCIYPNPASEKVTIISKGMIAYKILTVSGQEIVSAQAKESASVDISGLSKGIYVVKTFTAGGGVFTSKLIKK